MSKARDILGFLEKITMSVDDALKLLGISSEDAGDPKKLKKAYRDASLKHHPDRKGGSEEMMKQVNLAFETLKSRRFSGSSPDRSKIDQEYKDLGISVRNSLVSAFTPQAFVKHFEKITGKKFDYKVVAYPKDKERTPHWAGFNAEFSTDDREIIFDFRISAGISDIVRNKTLGGGGTISYSLGIVANGLANRRKVKLFQRDWNSNPDHAILFNPEMIFPKAKVKKLTDPKTKRKAFKKRDMETFIVKKLRGSLDDKWARIPIGKEGEDYKLVLWRSVFTSYDRSSKLATWSPNGLYKGFGRDARLEYVSFVEEEELTDFFTDLVKGAKKLSGDKLKNYLNKKIKDYRNSRPAQKEEEFTVRQTNNLLNKKEITMSKAKGLLDFLANDEARTEEAADAKFDAKVSAMWKQHAKGVNIAMMDIPHVFDFVKTSTKGGMGLEDAVKGAVAKFRKN